MGMFIKLRTPYVPRGKIILTRDLDLNLCNHLNYVSLYFFTPCEDLPIYITHLSTQIVHEHPILGNLHLGS